MKSFIAAALASFAAAQQVGHQKSEFHPPLNLHICTNGGGCDLAQKSVTLDANWRWTHKVNDYANCYTGTEWDRSVCSDGFECASKCAIDGVDTNDMRNTYGITSDGDGLRLNFVTQGQYAKNVGSRMYMMNTSDKYMMFQLKNKEFSFDVDVSNLPCGINGALYFVEMSEDGDMGMGANAAGAKYGTGYCDAQCPHDIKFIKGQANVEDWDSINARGKMGICCAEMDIWEANMTASAYTLHPCNVYEGSVSCNSKDQCGDDPDYRYNGLCDKDGCDLNPYRAGVHSFFGEHMTVDTTKPFTVVTQFVTEDGTDDSDIVEVKRFFVQNGRHIAHPESNVPGAKKQYDSITDEMCDDFKEVFGDQNDYKAKGGMRKMSDALGRGVVLVMSLWDDHADRLLWLDSKEGTGAGAERGPCPTSSGNPDDVERESPNAYVKYSNIKVGDIGSTNPQAVYEFLQ